MTTSTIYVYDHGRNEQDIKRPVSVPVTPEARQSLSEHQQASDVVADDGSGLENGIHDGTKVKRLLIQLAMMSRPGLTE